VGGSNGDGAWRGLVTILELIDPRPYIFQFAVYGRLIYTVIYMSDRLFTQANTNPHFIPPSVSSNQTHPPFLNKLNMRSKKRMTFTCWASRRRTRMSEPDVLAPYAKESLGSRTTIKNVGQNIKILMLEWVKSLRSLNN